MTECMHSVALVGDAGDAPQAAAKPVARGAAKRAAKDAAIVVPKSRPHIKRAKGRDQRGSYGRRIVSNLRRDDGALAVLASFGLSRQTILTVGLGIKEPYCRVDGETVSGVLVYPVSGVDERTRYGCVNLPGRTENPEHPVAWSTGIADVVAYGSGDMALICSSPLEAWVACQAAGDAGVAITAMASTRPDTMPDTWSKAPGWTSWARVAVTDGVPRAFARSLAEACGRPVERFPSAPSPGDAGPVRAEELADWIAGVVDGHRPLLLAGATHNLLPPGDYEPSRVSVHGGLHDGQMFYAFPVERRERGPSGTDFVFSYRTLVLRSDGAVLEPGLLPAPPGTPIDRRVHALSDGTRIAPIGSAPSGATWSLAGIKRFAARAQTRDGYDGPCGRDLLARIDGHLRTVVWLPDGDAYEQVAAYIMATYFHRLFDAFPLLFVHGPKNSGKSELMAGIVAVAFNASLMAQGTAAALVRLAHESGGVVAIDDAEALTAGFGELAQVLKTGYKASTSIKRMVGATGSVATVDFFGPRVLCNTRGIEDVLLSRCITVATAPLSAGRNVDDSLEIDPAALRDMLHDFAMSHVGEMAAIVRARRGAVVGRSAEIAFPLEAVRALVAS